jgi:hypothetical protein
MVRMKNKQTLFLVVRLCPEDRNTVVVAASDNIETAENLMGEYNQLMFDKGYAPEEVTYRLDTTTFYT